MRTNRLRPLFIVGLAGVLSLGCAAAPSAVERTKERTEVDRPDDFSGPQVHLLYVLPKDGLDERLDTNGTLRRSVAAFQKWFAGQSGGRQVRIDTYRGEPDITFIRLSVSDAEIRKEGDFARDRIEAELNKVRALSTTKIYATYYGGGHDLRCADAPHPPVLFGNVAVLYLKGTPPGVDVPPCADNPFAADEDHPGYLEFTMLHEIFHVMGAVSVGARHYVEGDHVGDNRHDLMYAGKEIWDPTTLDFNKDDYYGHNRSDLWDVEDSPFIQ